MMCSVESGGQPNARVVLFLVLQVCVNYSVLHCFCYTYCIFHLMVRYSKAVYPSMYNSGVYFGWGYGS